MKIINIGGENMKNVTIAHDILIQGYGVIKAGSKFKVQKYNSRYIYAYMNGYTILRLAYSDTTAKRPNKKAAK